MASNQLALLAQAPRFDVAKPIKAAQDIVAGDQVNEARGMQNQLSAMKLTEAAGEHNALMAFRGAAGKGEKDALAHLKAYPELRAQLQAAYDKLDRTPKLRAQAEGKMMAIATAAKNVAMLPANSPERKAAWNAELERLKAAGEIDEQRFNMFYDNPSDVIIDQALALGETTEAFIKRRFKDGGGGVDADTLLKIESQVADYGENYFGTNNYGYLNEDQVKEREAAMNRYREELMNRVGAGKGATTSAAGSPAAGSSETPAPSAAEWKPGMAPPPSHAGAVRISDRAQLEALPSGTPVILPDGRPTWRQ